MDTPQTPRGSSSPESDDDPTGVRALLSSLPDPGPMPDDVTVSIRAALAREQSRRGTAADNVSPLLGGSSRRQSAGSASAGSSRHRWLAPVASLGAAAAIAIGAIASYQGLSSHDAPAAAVPQATQSTDTGSVLDRVSIENSGRDYTKAGLATEAAALTSSTSTMDPTRAESPGIGPVGTRVGLLACMTSIGTSVLDADHISADLGAYDGKPAVIVVVTKAGKSTAWVVSRSCTNASGKIAGPTTVA